MLYRRWKLRGSNTAAHVVSSPSRWGVRGACGPDAAGGSPPACPGRTREDSLRRSVLGTGGTCSRRGNGPAALRLPAGSLSAERPEGDAPGAPRLVASTQVQLLRRKAPSGRARRGPSATARGNPELSPHRPGSSFGGCYRSQRPRRATAGAVRVGALVVPPRPTSGGTGRCALVRLCGGIEPVPRSPCPLCISRSRTRFSASGKSDEDGTR